MIPYGRQWISEEDIDAVVEVLRSDFLTQGPAIERFEDSVAEYCGARYAVAVSNGTAALHLAAIAFDLGPGDRLWTTPITFVASANCARYVGADVDFVDIDLLTCNMNVDVLAERLEVAERNDTLPKVVVPVHFGGASCEMGRIRRLSERYGFAVLEDGSHAIGGRYGDDMVGSCVNSDATVFSFHPVKIVTSGEGGMVLTNNEALAQRIRLMRTHGITRDAECMRGDSQGGWYYEQIALGYNYRITDIQAALGASQMTRASAWVERRNELARLYQQRLAGLPVKWQLIPEGVTSAYHLFVVRLDNADRGRVYEGMRARGIGVNVHYIPVHLQPYYQDLGFKRGDFPIAEHYYDSALTLPLFPSMKDSDVDAVVEALAGAIREGE